VPILSKCGFNLSAESINAPLYALNVT
jgi:hypothetical protein